MGGVKKIWFVRENSTTDENKNEILQAGRNLGQTKKVWELIVYLSGLLHFKIKNAIL
jgi:hypothetical protein